MAENSAAQASIFEYSDDCEIRLYRDESHPRASQHWRALQIKRPRMTHRRGRIPECAFGWSFQKAGGEPGGASLEDKASRSLPAKRIASNPATEMAANSGIHIRFSPRCWLSFNPGTALPQAFPRSSGSPYSALPKVETEPASAIEFSASAARSVSPLAFE